MSLQSPHRDEQVVMVTTARLSHTDDIALRERRYALSQGLRLACVVLGVVLPVPVPVKLLLFVGAVFLPWFGVVMANAGPVVPKARRTAIADDLRETLPEPPLRLAIEPGRVVDVER
jgi:hypothetical protein